MTLIQHRLVLVTGGSGFIGSHVCDALLAKGIAVRCMDNLATSKRDNIAHLEGLPDFSFVEGDIRSADDCSKAVAGVEAIVHLAALGSVPRSIKDPLATHATNLTGFLNMLEAARHEGVERMIYASSSSVYGDSKELPKREENIGYPLSPYAVTKAGNETYARLYGRLHGLGTIGLRFFNVFGERQDPEGPYAAAIPKFIKRLLQHHPPQVFGDGLQSRDFTYVGNAVQAVLRALRTDEPKAMGEVYNIAFGACTNVLELVNVLRSELALVDPAIASIGVEHLPERAGDIRDSLADVSKARILMGYAPSTDLRAGLAKAVPWYIKHWA